MKEISVVIPVYNSEACVLELSRQIADSLDGIEYEQIMVNDCSKDASWAKIQEAINNGYPVIGINLRKNSGQDNAILAGLNFVCGNWIVIMDDDLQHNPADILKLYAKVKDGYDVCYADFLKKKQRWWKNLGSWLNGKFAEVVISKPKGIYLSPFKIMKKEIAQEIIRSNNLYPYIDGMIFQFTHNIAQIAVEHHKRERGKSNYNLIRSIKVFAKLVFGFSIIPLRIASVLGSVSAVTGFFLTVFYLIQYLQGEVGVEGWTTIVILILFIGGLNLLSLGIIGEYLGRTYLTINNSPKFVIAEVKKNETK